MRYLCILRDYGMDGLFVVEKRPWQRYAAMAFCFHRRFADCRLQTASDSLSAKCGSFCPGSRIPLREPGQRKKYGAGLEESR